MFIVCMLLFSGFGLYALLKPLSEIEAQEVNNDTLTKHRLSGDRETKYLKAYTSGKKE